MQFLFLSKVPVNEPLQVPQQCPMERAARLQGLFFYISLKFLVKIPLNKKNYPFSQRPYESVPPFSPKAGPLLKQTSISRALLTMFSGSPVKEHPLQVPLLDLPQREIPHSQNLPSFIFQRPSYTTPYQVPQRGPYGNPRLQSLFYISSKVPSNEVPLLGSPHRAPSETLHPQSPLHLSKTCNKVKEQCDQKEKRERKTAYQHLL